MEDGWKYGDEVILMPKLVEPLGQTQSDYRICAELAARLGLGAAYTEGRDERAWVEWCLDRYRATRFPDLPTLDEFERSNNGVYAKPVTKPAIAFEDFRADPDAHPLDTPSGKIEIFSKALHGKGRPDEIPAVPKYVEEWESPFGPEAAAYDLSKLSNQGVNWSDISKLSNQGINWSDISILSNRGINWSDISKLGNAGVNWSDISIMSNRGVNWSSVALLSNQGINWTDISIMSNRGVNWTDVSVLSGRGVNWSDISKLSNQGINWSDISKLSNAGVNWSDLSKLSNQGVNWSDITILTEAGVNWSDITVLSESGVNWSDVTVLTEAGVNWSHHGTDDLLEMIF